MSERPGLCRNDFRPGTVVDWSALTKLDSSLHEVADDEVNMFIGSHAASDQHWWYIDDAGRLRIDRWGECDARAVAVPEGDTA